MIYTTGQSCAFIPVITPSSNPREIVDFLTTHFNLDQPTAPNTVTAALGFTTGSFLFSDVQEHIINNQHGLVQDISNIRYAFWWFLKPDDRQEWDSLAGDVSRIYKELGSLSSVSYIAEIQRNWVRSELLKMFARLYDPLPADIYDVDEPHLASNYGECALGHQEAYQESFAPPPYEFISGASIY